MGSVYLRGKTWWIQYYRNGEPYQESSKSKKKTVANELLKKREGEKGKVPSIHFEKVTFEELVEGLVTDYELKGQRRPRVAHLKKFFNRMRVLDVTTTKVREYINKRLSEGAKNATINLELAALKRMFNLGNKETPPKVDRVPHIPMLEVNNVKQGFFEDDDYQAFLEKLPDYMQGPVQFAYLTGWRVEQILGITWDMVQDRFLVVPGTMTKNGSPHTIYLNDLLLEIIKDRTSKRNLGCPYVFHSEGKRITDFRFVWNKACRDSGLGYGYRVRPKYVKKWEKKLKPGPTMHDFRRTCTRNLTKVGVPQQIIMKMVGMKTDSIFRRYAIVTTDDLKWASEKQAENLKPLQKPLQSAIQQ